MSNKRSAIFPHLSTATLVILLLLTMALKSGSPPLYLSPSDLDLFDKGRKLIITEHTANQLAIFDVENEEVIRTIELEIPPNCAICSMDEKHFYVTAGNGPGSVLIIDAKTGKIQETISVGHTPVAPVLSKDGRKLYVCNRFDHSVDVVSLVTKRVIKTIPVSREPIAAELTPDGRLLFVANHLPDGVADVDYLSAKITVIGVDRDEVINSIALVNGSEGLRGVSVSPDGRYLFTTHLLARYQVPTTQIEKGWINTNAVSIIRVSDQKLLHTVLLDDLDHGFANPWAVEVSEDGLLLCVTSAGNHELRLIDLPALLEKLNRVAEQQLQVHNDLTFITELSRRVQLKGTGPRAMVMNGASIYLAEYFSNSLGRIELNESGEVNQVSSTPLGPEAPLTAERLGEIYFNDASLCFQNWQSCASCHSDDGRVDGLNWDLLNDGIGNPKNVKSLLLSHETPPAMALGVRAHAELAVRAGIRYIQFAVRPEEDALALDAYLKSLKPVPSPSLVNGKLSQAALRGKALFEAENCMVCHPAPLYTDLKQYELGTGKGLDAGKKFDTPTLIEVWRTSPYLHDGRVVTMEKLIEIHNPSSERNSVAPLTLDEIRDLAEYVESL